MEQGFFHKIWTSIKTKLQYCRDALVAHKELCLKQAKHEKSDKTREPQKKDQYPFFAREYRLCEEQFLSLAKSVLISDQNFEQPLPASPDLLLNICSNIEGLSKELHRQLSEIDYYSSSCDLLYQDEESFDFEALRFLDKTLGLTYKCITISTELVVISADKRQITPLKNASLSTKNPAKNKKASKKQGKAQQPVNADVRPNWCYAYQDCKHDRGTQLVPDPINFDPS